MSTDMFEPTQGSSSSSAAIVASAHATAARTTNSTTPFNFDTVDWDSNTYITTGAAWKFLPLTQGTYIVMIGTQYTNGVADLQLYKNGTFYRYLYTINTGATAQRQTGGTQVQLNGSTDYIDIRTAASAGFDNNANSNWICISLVK